MRTAQGVTLESLRHRLAQAISEYGITDGAGSAGSLEISVKPSAARTFRAHWTGYRLAYPQKTLVLLAWLNDGSFWTEGYISTAQPSYVLSFRKKPHSDRGTGAERPDDKLAAPQAIDQALAARREWVRQGIVPDEEIIRYEDFDDPFEAIDEFFTYMSFYCLKAVGADWSSFGYTADPSVGWDAGELAAAAMPFDAALDEGLKRSDILWLSPDTKPGIAVPCWFLYTKDQRLYVLSGEEQQIIPEAAGVRKARIVTRRKGRDARMAEFDASVRVITPREDRDEFEEVAELLLAKRQSVTGSHEENIARWMRDCVILEITPL